MPILRIELTTVRRKKGRGVVLEMLHLYERLLF